MPLSNLAKIRIFLVLMSVTWCKVQKLHLRG